MNAQTPEILLVSKVPLDLNLAVSLMYILHLFLLLFYIHISYQYNTHTVGKACSYDHKMCHKVASALVTNHPNCMVTWSRVTTSHFNGNALQAWQRTTQLGEITCVIPLVCIISESGSHGNVL